jgi:tetratricopeptide (TPR) repeat protein
VLTSFTGLAGATVNKLTRPHEWSRASAAPAGPRAAPVEHHYFAFLSYSHQDSEEAEWLHQQLESFRVPATLVGKLTASGVIPKRLTPVFRDQHDLAASHDLNEEIRAALKASRSLIVLCSPSAAKSKWTNAEIETFKRVHPEGCIIAAVVAGEPLASDIPGREDEECFPPALIAKYNRRGKPTGKRAEPLAADLRPGKGGRRTGFLKIVAGMLGIGLDDLVQREATRRQRRLIYLAAASLAGMAVTSTLAVTAIQARDAAREQRRQAEGLVAFMLGDLKDKLEPIGRLDALDGVGARVLAYYQKEGTSELSDAALLQRSQALSLMAEVATKRGDDDGALRLYRGALAGTAEAIRRNPGDPQRLFDHAQNIFYVGQIAEKRGDLTTAERYMRQYQDLARRMVRLGPDNMKWRMEVQYADFDLGTILYDQRRFAEAAAQFQDSLSTIEAISTADPANLDYRESVAESLAWLADARQALGQYDAATAARQRDISLLDALFARTRDRDYQYRLVSARRALGRIYADRGQRDAAIEQYRIALAHADSATAFEPSNAQWIESGVGARFSLARELAASGLAAEAASLTDAGCSSVNLLLRRDPANVNWRRDLITCLVTKSRLAIAAGRRAEALGYAKRAVGVAERLDSGDAPADRFILAKSLLWLGDVERDLGVEDGARAAWTSALAAMPNVAERPAESADRAKVLLRLGRIAEAAPLQARLRTIGFRDENL